MHIEVSQASLFRTRGLSYCLGGAGDLFPFYSGIVNQQLLLIERLVPFF